MNNGTPKYVLEARIKNAEAELKKLKEDLAEVNKTSVKDNLAIVWSRDKSCFYLSDGFNMPMEWLSTDFVAEPLTDEERGSGLIGPYTIQYTCKRTGQTYKRKAWPFTYWSIKSLPERESVKWPGYEDLSDEARRINDYVIYATNIHGWKGWD